MCFSTFPGLSWIIWSLSAWDFGISLGYLKYTLVSGSINKVYSCAYTGGSPCSNKDRYFWTLNIRFECPSLNSFKNLWWFMPIYSATFSSVILMWVLLAYFVYPGELAGSAKLELPDSKDTNLSVVVSEGYQTLRNFPPVVGHLLWETRDLNPSWWSRSLYVLVFRHTQLIHFSHSLCHNLYSIYLHFVELPFHFLV